MENLPPLSSPPPPSSLPGPLALLKESLKIYKSKITVFLKIIILFVLIFLPYQFLTKYITGNALQSASYLDNPLLLFSLIPVFLMLSLISFLVYSLGQIAFIFIIKDNLTSAVSAYKLSLRIFLSYWWISFLYAFITIGGSFLFIIPGLMFIFWFSQATYILITENIRGMNALLKSREYVREKLLALLGRWLFIGLLSLVIIQPVSLIFKFLNLENLRQIVNSVLSFLFLPLSITYNYLIFVKLQESAGSLPFQPKKSTKVTYFTIAISGYIIMFILIVLIARFLKVFEVPIF